MTHEKPQLSTRRGAFGLGSWIVRSDLRQIQRGTTSKALEPRQLDVLLLLASRPGQVFSRDEILEAVWRDVVVNEESLTRVISGLRRLFEDDSREPQYIQTIRKSGYRLVATPEDAPSEDLSAAADIPFAAKALAGEPEAPVTPRSSTGDVSLPWQVFASVAAVVIVAAIAFGIGSSHERSKSSFEIVPLTTYHGDEITPALSPDGSRVAFAGIETQGGDADLYLQEVGAAEAIQLTEGPTYDHWPSWSDDGEELVFLRHDEAAKSVMRMNLIDGQERRVFRSEGYFGGIQWIPGTRSAVLSLDLGSGSRFAVYRLNVDTGDTTALLTPGIDEIAMWRPAVSQDGSQIACIQVDQSDYRHVLVADIEGGGRRSFFSPDLWPHALAWCRDGRSLVVAARRGTQNRLHLLDTRNGDWTLLAIPGTDLLKPNLVARSDRLVFEQRSTDQNIWRLDLSDDLALDSEATAVAPSTWNDHSPELARDGRIALISNRTGSAQVWICEPDGSRCRRLSSHRGGMVSTPRWSPDGTRLVYDFIHEGEQSLYMAEVNGAPPAPLPFRDQHQYMAGWSASGQHVFVTSQTEQGWAILAIDLRDPESDPRVVVRGAVYGEGSPDGRWLYFIRPDRSRVWRIRADGSGEPKEVVAGVILDPQGYNWRTWDRGIVVLREDIDGSTVHRIDIEAETTTQVAHLRNVPAGQFAVNREATVLLFSRRDRAATDLMLVERFR